MLVSLVEISGGGVSGISFRMCPIGDTGKSETCLILL